MMNLNMKFVITSLLFKFLGMLILYLPVKNNDFVSYYSYCSVIVVWRPTIRFKDLIDF